MKKSRSKDSPWFNAKVVVEVLKGKEPTGKVASRFQVHPSQILTWKKARAEGTPGIFGGDQGQNRKQHEQLIARLYQQLSELKAGHDGTDPRAGIARDQSL